MTGTILLGLGAFLASAVEAVEALTIVLGVGVVRGWRSTLIGVGAALLVLAALIAVLGPALGRIPIDGLRLVVGALLLVFGLQWLRKAILRATAGKRSTTRTRRSARSVSARLQQVSTSAAVSIGTPSRSRSRACCSRGSRSCSS
jgi:uncharacterized membrane protein